MQKLRFFDALEPMLDEHGVTAVAIGLRQTGQIIRSWRNHFGASDLEKNENLWHVFSWKYYDHLSGQEAIEKFNNTYLKRFIVFSTDNYNAVRCDSPSIFIKYQDLNEYLSQLEFITDIYIIQHNFKWTFVIPHESDLGPYYASPLLI